MSRREKRNEKRGISLVGFVVILIALVCVEGIYIVKLRKTDNNVESNNDELVSVKNTNDNTAKEVSQSANKNDQTSENANSLNIKIISSLGFNADTMIEAMLDNVQKQTEIENVVKFVDNAATEELVNTQEFQEKRSEYKTVIMNNFDKEDIINSVKFENGKLTCVYNLKNMLNLIGLESNAYVGLGADENNIVVYNFN